MARQRMSGRELAKRVGKSANWVSLKVSGAQRIDLDEVAMFADALGVTVVDLFPRRDREVTVTYPGGRVTPLFEALQRGPREAKIPAQRRPTQIPPADPGRTSRVYPNAA